MVKGRVKGIERRERGWNRENGSSKRREGNRSSERGEMKLGGRLRRD